MKIRERVLELLETISLIRRANTAFLLASKEKDKQALEVILEARRKYGNIAKYRFGVELVLLEIFLRECLDGVEESDYDWEYLKGVILSSEEYNDAERVHLLIYLEELSTTAGVTIALDSIINVATAGQKVSSRLIRRFPKLSAMQPS